MYFSVLVCTRPGICRRFCSAHWHGLAALVAQHKTRQAFPSHFTKCLHCEHEHCVAVVSVIQQMTCRSGESLSTSDCLVSDGSNLCASLMSSHEGLHADESFGCDVLLRRALTDDDVDPPPAFSDPVTLSLAPQERFAASHFYRLEWTPHACTAI